LFLIYNQKTIMSGCLCSRSWEPQPAAVRE